MNTLTYTRRRAQLETYFDRTAVQAWARMTSDAPLGSIRATVRAGRDRMRATLLSWLPEDLSGRRLLDAGCGTGALALEAARRGAEVIAVDLSPTLISLARERCRDAGPGRLDFVVGDMLDPAFGSFDHVVAMDSLIHYRAPDMAAAVGALAARASGSVLFTVAPRTMLLTVMHTVGRLFPRSSRAPAIEPVASAGLVHLLAEQPALVGWQLGRSARVDSGFYISEAEEMVPA
jgi:magnesium-protoporphyrin O-methyltransferase